MVKTEIKIKIKLDKGKELSLSLEDAKTLFGELGQIFEKEKIYVNYPWYVYTYPISIPKIIYGDNTSSCGLGTGDSITVANTNSVSTSDYIINIPGE